RLAGLHGGTRFISRAPPGGVCQVLGPSPLLQPTDPSAWCRSQEKGQGAAQTPTSLPWTDTPTSVPSMEEGPPPVTPTASDAELPNSETSHLGQGTSRDVDLDPGAEQGGDW
ncbi:hypothetical protein H1C71_007964, partial [Ictidomys tridecemlineatus]